MKKLFTFVGLLIATMVTTGYSGEDKTVLFFGDSITAGGGWVKALGDQLGINAINAGKSGRRAAQAREELAPYLKQYPSPDLIVMFLGVNDLPRYAEDRVAKCVKNMNDAIDLALQSVKAQQIVLVAPCSVNPETMSKKVIGKGYRGTQPFLEGLEKGYKKLAEEKGVHFFSLLNVVSKENYRDGLHPNADGDKEIAEAFKAFLPTVLTMKKADHPAKGLPEPVSPTSAVESK